MNLLDAVNLIMPKLGERAVTSLDARHPTLAVLLPIVERTQKTMLLRGWWFNEFDYTAYPGTDGSISMGTDTLAFVPTKSDTAVLRGGKLYNPTTLADTFTDHVQGRVVQYVTFNELPESAAAYVLYAALIDMYATDLGATDLLRVWGSLAAQAWSDLLAEHLKQRKFSTRRSRRWLSYVNALRS